MGNGHSKTMSLTNLLSNFMVLIFGSYVALGVLESFTKLSLRLFCKANKVLNSWFVSYVPLALLLSITWAS